MATISIVTICYNAESSITVTANSVLNQSYRDFEYIIIDGASTDRTREKINELNDGRIQVYSEPDRGISDAFNKGLKKATGEYILFLNSGDYFLTSNCLKQVADALKHNAYDIVTFSVKIASGEKIPKDECEGQECWETSMVPHQGTFVKKSVFDKVGCFNEYFRIRMDYDFFKRCKKNKCSFLCVPSEIVYYDINGISSNYRYLFEKEGLAIRLLYNEDIRESDINLMLKLSNKYDSNHNSYQINLKKDICCNDINKRELFWKYKHYVIYGAGVAGYRLYNNLKKEIDSHDIIVCDTYKSGQFMKEFNQEIKSVSSIKECGNQDAIIMSIQNKLALCEVYSSLLNAGVEKERIYIYDEEKLEIR